MFWKEGIEAMYDLRIKIKPIADYDFLSWPVWYDDLIKIKGLNKYDVRMVADLLDPIWNMIKEI